MGGRGVSPSPSPGDDLGDDDEELGFLADVCLREWGISLDEFYDTRATTDLEWRRTGSHGLTLARLNSLIEAYLERRRSDAMASAVLNATASHNPKDTLKVVGSIYGSDTEARHNPHEPSDFEEWSWERSGPSE